MKIYRAAGLLLCLAVVLASNSGSHAQTCQNFTPDTHECIDAFVKPVTKNAPDNGSLKNQSLTITPVKLASLPQHDKLYRVDIVCTRKTTFPANTGGGVLVNQKTLSTHVIGLVNTSLTAASMPSATDTSSLVLIPVFAITGDATSLAVFDNTNEQCSRSFLVSGRDQPTIVATLSVQTLNNPSTFANVLYGLLNTVTPLASLLGGFGAFIKADAPAMTGTQTPLSQMLAQLNSANTALVNAKLLIGTDPDKSKRATVIETPWTKISITASEMQSIQDSGDQTLISAFEKTFDVLSTNVIKPPSGVSMRQACSQLGRGLQFDRNLTVQDTAYALAHVVYLGGLARDGIIECLGREYGPTAVKLPYWKQTPQLSRISVWEFPKDDPTDVTQPDFASYLNAYQELVLALNSFAEAFPHGMQTGDDAKPQAVALLQYFEHATDHPDIFGIDATGLTNLAVPTAKLPTNNFMPLPKGALDFISQVVAKGYVHFGCPTSDAVANPASGTTTSTGGEGAAVAILAFKDDKDKTSGSYKPDDVIIVRLWIDAPIISGYSPFNKIKISSETNALSTILTANSFRCGPGFAVAQLPNAGSSDSGKPAAK